MTRRYRVRFAPWALLLALAAVSALAVELEREAPATLAETGLYDDFEARRLAAGVEPFTVQYPLWTDGAHKRRWIALPAGTTIDASDPDGWRFPAGTRIWKEFSLGGRRIETRYMERSASGEWLFATYRWSADEGAATLVGPRGVKRAAESAPGVPYAIPGVVECRACHESGRSAVLGFSTLQLSSDRDPNAPHATPPEAGSLDLDALVRRGLVVGLPEDLASTPPRVRAASPIARAALGYLHGNCSNCHHAESPIASLGLSLTVRADGTPEALETAVDCASQYRPTGTEIHSRIVPGDPGQSLLIARVVSRDPVRQMPPMGTHRIDEQGVALLSRWIAEELAFPPAASGEIAVQPLAPASETTLENVP
jgi:hypothetical protein